MNDITYNPALQVFVQWSGHAPLDETCSCRVKYRDGKTIVVTGHSCSHWVPVKNGPFSIGRSWYTVDGDPREYDTLHEVVEAYRTKPDEQMRIPVEETHE